MQLQQRSAMGAGHKAAPKTSKIAAIVPARAVSCKAQASSAPQPQEVSRRNLLAGTSALGLALASPGASIAARAPKGFNAWEDQRDGYKFFYPFGWQEVAVNGADVVFKDIVEPLESVSVTLTKTDRSDITEFGEVAQVAEALAKDVLTGPGQEVKVLSSSTRETNGRTYYEFEFSASAPNYTRHQLAVVTAANNTFYTLTTGSSEKRWGKMKDRLDKTVKSFILLY